MRSVLPKNAQKLVLTIAALLVLGLVHPGYASVYNVMPGDTITTSILTDYSDIVNMYGGSITGRALGINSSGSTINIYGGTISGGSGNGASGIIANNSTINLYGGTISGGNANATYGQAIGVELWSSIMNIYGGTINGGTGSSCMAIYFCYGSTLNIYGRSFTNGFGKVYANEGTITGTYADGSECSLDFAQYGNSQINLLPVPEPSSILALLGGLGSIGSYAYWRKRK